MSKYRFKEHTADVEFTAFGNSIGDCFSNALIALFDTIAYTKKLKKSKAKNFQIKIKDRAKNLDDLFWYTLQDVVSISDSKGLFPYKILKIDISEKNNNYTINAKIVAKKSDDKYSKIDVKGVSRYNLSVKKKANRFEANAVLDI